jgi:hypothetical protein
MVRTVSVSRNIRGIVDERNQTVIRPLVSIAVHVNSITPVSLRRGSVACAQCNESPTLQATTH